MIWFFTTVFYQPLFNLLVWIYDLLPNHDLGLSIIILTVLVKLALFPVSWMQIKAQKELQDIQPKLTELKERFKNDKQGLAQAQMELFQAHKINPLASCFPVIIQLPFLIAIARVFYSGIGDEGLSLLYPFVHNPEHLSSSFLGILNLTDTHTLILPIIAGILQGLQTWMLTAKAQRPPKVPGSRDEDLTVIMNRQMLFIMPVMTAFAGYRFAAGLSLYWLVNIVITVIQQLIFLRQNGGAKTDTLEVLPPAAV